MKTLTWMLHLTLLVASCAILMACTSTETAPTNAAEQPPKTTPNTEQRIAEYCISNPCRENVNIWVATVEGEARLQADYFCPVVREQQIVVLAGERVFVEAQFNGEGQISGLHYVPENRYPDRTFEINFQQSRGSYGMHYTVRNPFTYPVHFDVALTDINGETRRIGSCPVRGKRSYLERFQDPALHLTLSNPRVLPEHAAIVCVG